MNYKIIGADGKQYGPISLERLKEWANQKRLNAQSRVQAEGSTEWLPASQVPELASLFVRPPGEGPPPVLTRPASSQPDRGLAIASFVLGLVSIVLCLNVFTGIPAIICGHIARRRAVKAPTRFAGAGFATTGFILGYLSIIISMVVLGFVMPAASHRRFAPQSSQLSDCENNMVQIGLALKVWALEHNDQYPFNVSTKAGGSLELCDRGSDGFEKNSVPHFLVISNELSTPIFLVCPNDSSKHAAPNFASLGPANVSYRLRTGPSISAENPQEVLAVCPVHGNELYCDGNVRKNRRARQ